MVLLGVCVLTTAVVPAAGTGVRLRAGVPKALALLDGEPLLVHGLRALLAAPGVGALVVAAPEAELSEVAGLVERLRVSVGADTPMVVVAGGATRQASVACGLAGLPPGTDVVLVHDAARPLVPVDTVERVVAAVRAGAEAVVPALPVADTIKQVHGDTVVTTLNRAGLVAVQTPQGFHRDVLVSAYAAAGAETHTDDAGLVERAGGRVTVVPGHPDALKVTTAHDLVVARAVLAARRG